MRMGINFCDPIQIVWKVTKVFYQYHLLPNQFKKASPFLPSPDKVAKYPLMSGKSFLQHQLVMTNQLTNLIQINLQDPILILLKVT